MRHYTPFASIAALLMVLGAAVLLPGCGFECEGSCECNGSECVCAEAEDCLVDCGEECSLQCPGSGACDLACDELCTVGCTGSGACTVSVGDDSFVDCSGSGGCEVDCDGDCTLSCPGAGVCVALCEPGFECFIEDCGEGAQSCPDGSLVCNGACP